MTSKEGRANMVMDSLLSLINIRIFKMHIVQTNLKSFPKFTCNVYGQCL